MKHVSIWIMQEQIQIVILSSHTDEFIDTGVWAKGFNLHTRTVVGTKLYESFKLITHPTWTNQHGEDVTTQLMNLL